MRILIYIEPHPIRDSQVMFDHVARRFLPLFARSTSDFDIRMYSTGTVLDRLGDKAPADIEKRLIRATPAEENLFAGHLCDWESEGIPAWLSLMEGGTVADDYVQVLRRIWSVFPFDIIVHWAENGAVSRFVAERPITRIALELGCTRNPFMSSVVMDPFGTNGNATVPRLSLDDLRAIVDDNPMSAAEALYGYSAKIESLPWEQQFLPLENGDLSARVLAAKGKIAFLPLQLHDDANLLRFSPYSTVKDVVLDAVPKLAEAGYTVIIKAHPVAKNRPQSRFAFSLARAALKPWADKIVWVDETMVSYTNAQLMALSDLVVTVNSSVGFEALYYDKVVAVLGDAVYKPSGLFPDLDEAISGTFDLSAYQHGIGLLRRFMLGGYMAHENVLREFDAFRQILVTIDAARKAHGDDAVAVAKRIYQAFSLTTEHQARERLVKGGSVPGTGEFGVPVTKAAQPLAIVPKSAEISLTEFTGPARRLLDLTGAVDGDFFGKALRAAFGNPETAEKYIRTSRIVDEIFYLNTHSDVAKAAKDPVWHWARYGLHEGRKPRRGLNVGSLETLIDLLVEAAEPLFEGIPDFPLELDVEARRQASLDETRSGLGTRGNKVVVVAQLFYRNLVPAILEKLKNIPEDFDLVVTMSDWGSRQVAEQVLAVYPNALLYPGVNRGGDLGQFIDVLPALLEHDYDAILRLQTNAGYHVDGRLRHDLSDIWRGEALDALLGSPKRVETILDAFRSDPAIRQVGPRPHFVPLNGSSYPDGDQYAELLLGDSSPDGYFQSAMFWARPETLRTFIEPRALSLTSFPENSDSGAIALAHIVEQMFSVSALANDGVILGAPADPDEPLVRDPIPLEITIEKHLESALASKRAAIRARLSGVQA